MYLHKSVVPFDLGTGLIFSGFHFVEFGSNRKMCGFETWVVGKRFRTRCRIKGRDIHV